MYWGNEDANMSEYFKARMYWTHWLLVCILCTWIPGEIQASHLPLGCLGILKLTCSEKGQGMLSLLGVYGILVMMWWISSHSLVTFEGKLELTSIEHLGVTKVSWKVLRTLERLLGSSWRLLWLNTIIVKG